jgi:hypothetical protein
VRTGGEVQTGVAVRTGVEVVEVAEAEHCPEAGVGALSANMSGRRLLRYPNPELSRRRLLLLRRQRAHPGLVFPQVEFYLIKLNQG